MGFVQIRDIREFGIFDGPLDDGTTVGDQCHTILLEQFERLGMEKKSFIR